jgi:GNAT superfamily N-acetyltransferase
VSLDLFWCTESHLAKELGLFFASNVQVDYISHSELQGTRAPDESTWALNLAQEVTDEIASRIHETHARNQAGMEASPVMVARENGKLVGLAIVSFFPQATVPYAIVEDLVVAQEDRGREIGSAMLKWIMAEARRAGCVRAFLESGTRNAVAHQLFEREGFSVCSVVLMKTLGAPQ